jgi:hypothetical protein
MQSRLAELFESFQLLSRCTTNVSAASLQLCSAPVRITGKQRAVRIFGLSVFPEMRLTVSFRITYTLRPVWGAGAASEEFLLFFRSTANRATVIIQEHFAAALRFVKHQGGIERGLLS